MIHVRKTQRKILHDQQDSSMSSAETYEHFAVSKAQLEGNKYYNIGFNTGNMGPAHWGLGEIYGLLVHPGEASKLLTDHLITSLILAWLGKVV